MKQHSVRVRFAPSPTGKLHVGNVRSALYNYLFARRHGGCFVWRSDDTDQERSTRAYEKAIGEDLTFLGLEPQEKYRQSERFDTYHTAAQDLRAKGLLYDCYETPEELDKKRKLQRAQGKPPIYDRGARNWTEAQKKEAQRAGRKPHWRFLLSRSVVEIDDLVRGRTSINTAHLSDPVLIREDGQFLYTLPSCVDDIEMRISHVIRGEDHMTNSVVQVEIMRALGGEAPVFAHHSLLVDVKGQSLSKRIGSLGISDLARKGFEPMAINSYLARLGSLHRLAPENSMDILATEFDFAQLGRAPSRFNIEDMLHFNAHIVQNYTHAQIARRLDISVNDWAAIRNNIGFLKDAGEWLAIAYGSIHPAIADEDADFCMMAAEMMEKDATLSWEELTAKLAQLSKRRGKQMFMPLRKALTGKSYGPNMAQLFKMIGAKKATARLRGQEI